MGAFLRAVCPRLGCQGAQGKGRSVSEPEPRTDRGQGSGGNQANGGPDPKPDERAAKGRPGKAQKATHHSIKGKRYRVHGWTIAQNGLGMGYGTVI